MSGPKEENKQTNMQLVYAVEDCSSGRYDIANG